MTYTAALLAGAALAQGALVASGRSVIVNVVDTFGEGEDGIMTGAPEWCRNETELTWKQRRERLLQHETLEWCKAQVKTIQAANESVPDWMDKIVEDDRKRGQMKWAAAEMKRLKAEGKEVPQWMDWAAAENEKWGNRWAACKAAELQAAGQEPPTWMAENGRKGILEYAAEKQKDLEEQIDELEDEMEEEEALVQADGNTTLAEEKRLAMEKAVYRKSPHQQLEALQAALTGVDESEDAWKEGTDASPKQLKHALKKAQHASIIMEKILARLQKAREAEEQQSAAADPEPVVDVTAE